jgi:hypothetical protein
MREAFDEAAGDRIGYGREHDRNCPRLAGKCGDPGRGIAQDRVSSQIDQLFCERPRSIGVTGAPAKFDTQIAAFRPP